jgi:uncharacterized protein
MVRGSRSLAPSFPAFMPMLDLFRQLRAAGMKLTIDQYDLLREALDEEFGLEDWEDLRDVCRMLWVKPTFDDSAEIFEQVFDAYQIQYHQQLEDWFDKQRKSNTPPPLQEICLGVLPKAVPPRKFAGKSGPETQTDKDEPTGYGIDAVKHDRAKPAKPQREYLVKVPLATENIKRTWRTLRRPIADARLQQLDMAATVERIGREGIFSDVVRRPVMQKKAELLLLIDDSNAMLPFAPVIQPLIQMVQERRIAPSQIYRFNQCPTDYLYDWQRPLRGMPLSKVLGRLNRLRTVVMIVSDAGAASPLYSPERVARTGKFLSRLLPCVREVLWLNPLPERRWEETTASPIQAALAGRMVPFEARRLQCMAQVGEFKSGVQLWSLMQPK